MRPPNTLGFTGNYLGTAGFGFNQYLEAPVGAVPSILPRRWSGRFLTFTTLSIGRGIVDHIHYVMRTDGSQPTAEDLASCPIWRSDMLVLELPQSASIMVYMVAHDAFHRTYGSPLELTPWGEYWVDTIAPSGSLTINDGGTQTSERLVKLHINGHDAMSGLADVYIDGDVDPTDPRYRKWTPYSSAVDTLLAEIEGKKTVTIKLRDNAGNVSSAFWSTIIYPMVRYFFDKLPITSNRLRDSGATFSVQTDNKMASSSNTMKEGSDSGRFTSI